MELIPEQGIADKIIITKYSLFKSKSPLEQKDRFAISCDEKTADRAGLDIRRLALDILRNILGRCASVNSAINNSNQPIIEDIFKSLTKY